MTPVKQLLTRKGKPREETIVHNTIYTGFIGLYVCEYAAQK